MQNWTDWNKKECLSAVPNLNQSSKKYAINEHGYEDITLRMKEQKLQLRRVDEVNIKFKGDKEDTLAELNDIINQI